MDNSRSQKSLGDYVELQRGNTYKSALLGQPGPVLLGLASIARNGGFRSDNLKTYGGDSDVRMLLEPGDIYVSLKDVTQSADLLGAVSRVPSTISQGRLTQDTVKLNFKDGNAPKDYIYWLLRTPQYRAYCRAHATGTTNLGLPRDDFLSFPVPDITPNRKELVSLLQAFDDKIELNRRTNETLEAMARAIFKDWFVDFGPTRAKAEGLEPYLSSELWDLFPDALGDDDKPMGWKVRKLEDYLELAYGKSLPAKQRKLGSVAVYGSGGVAGTHDTPLVEGPVVIVGRKGTVGSLYWEDGPAFPIDTVFYVVPRVGSLLFSYHLLSVQPLKDMNTDAAVPGLNRGNAYRLEFPRPHEQLIQAFENLVAPLWKRRAANLKEVETLAQTRDLLLPKLMSGEIRLRDAEKAVEAVA